MSKRLDAILKRLEPQFRVLAKKLAKPKFVLDIRVKTLKDMGIPNPAQAKASLQARSDRDFKGSYVVYNTRAELYSALKSVGAVGGEGGISASFTETSAAQDALVNTVLKEANRLAQYTSPDMRATISSKISDKIFDVFTKVTVDVSGGTRYDAKFDRALENAVNKSVKEFADRDRIHRDIEAVMFAAVDLKSKTKIFKKTESKKGKRKVGKVTRVTPIQTETGVFTSATQLQFLINALLHDAVQDNMGESSDPATLLRYQTGNFARSASVTSIRQVNKDVYIGFTYDRIRYDTFLPGGRLNPPTARDPRPIIGNAIRDIALKHVARTFMIHTHLEGYTDDG